MNIIYGLLCFFKFHDWKYKYTLEGGSERTCSYCGKKQRLVFYTNRTIEWEEI